MSPVAWTYQRAFAGLHFCWLAKVFEASRSAEKPWEIRGSRRPGGYRVAALLCGLRGKIRADRSDWNCLCSVNLRRLRPFSTDTGLPCSAADAAVRGLVESRCRMNSGGSSHARFVWFFVVDLLDSGA